MRDCRAMRPGQSPSSIDARNSRDNLMGGSARRQEQIIHSVSSQFTIGTSLERSQGICLKVYESEALSQILFGGDKLAQWQILGHRNFG